LEQQKKSSTGLERVKEEEVVVRFRVREVVKMGVF